MGILLTDEEIRNGLDKAYGQLEEAYGKHNMRENKELRQQVVNEYNDNLMHNIAQAQLKKVIDWLDAQDFYVRRLAPGIGFTGDYYLLRESPYWQALLKEAEEWQQAQYKA